MVMMDMADKLEWIVDHIVVLLIIEAFIFLNLAMIIVILHELGVI